MSEMVERVALAITRGRLNENPNLSPKVRDEQVEAFWRSYINDAKDAIAAMREPTTAMIRAGDASGGAPTGKPVNFPVTEDIWQAMIDEALK